MQPDKNLINSKGGYSEEGFKEDSHQLKIVFDRIASFKIVK